MNHRKIRMLTVVGALGAMGALVAALAVPATADASPAVHRAGTLRVMQWNIHGAVPVGGTAPDLGRIAAVIAAEDADVVTLNEVHQDPVGGGYHGDEPAHLAELLAASGYTHVQWGLAESNGDRGPDSTNGNLILSKYPLVGSPTLVKLPNENYEPGGKGRRSLLGVTIDVPRLGRVRVYSTHLSTPGSAALVEDQKAQTRIVLDTVDTSVPSILTGDFNIRVSDVETQAFSQNNLMQSWIAQDGLADTWRQIHDGEDGVSMTSAYGSTAGQDPDRRIDYVFATPSFRVLGGHMSTVDRTASDHLGVVMDLGLSSASRTRTVLAGGGGLGGWAQLTRSGLLGLSLSVCKNTGTAVDDGTAVRAVVRSATGRILHRLDDTGTTRGSCEGAAWTGLLPWGAALEVQVVAADGTVVSIRRDRF